MPNNMPTLFLASSISITGKDIAQKIFSRTNNQRLIFIPTAAEAEAGDKSWLHADREPLVTAGFDVIDFSITDKTPDEIESVLRGAATVCVAGGNTYYLLDRVRKSGFDLVISRLVDEGVFYIGASAGSILAGPTIQTTMDDRSIVPDLHDFSGLNLVDVSVRPHWGNESFASRYQEEMMRLYKLEVKMVLLRDSQYLLVEGESYQIVDVGT